MDPINRVPVDEIADFVQDGVIPVPGIGPEAGGPKPGIRPGGASSSKPSAPQTTLPPANAPSNVARPSTSPNYSVAYEAKLKKGVDYPGVKDTKHFQEANRQLHEAFQSDAKFAQAMEKQFPGIVDGVKPGKRGAFPSGPPTKDVTWHHHPNKEGSLQLVPRDHHRAPGPVQESLHPDQKGGMENWGGGRN